MKRSESAAKIIVEASITGATMHFRTDQSRGEHDFDLELPDLTVPLEVTVAANPTVNAMIAAIGDTRKGGSFVDRKEAQRDWWVHAAVGANVNKIRSNIDRYLAAVENEGLTEFLSHTGSAESKAVERIYMDLAIESGRVLEWNPPGRIGIAWPGQGTYVSSDHVQAAVAEESWKADNRRKLGAAVAPQRHLFVFVDPNRFDAWMGLTEDGPPTLAPSLPPEITDVWAATAIDRTFIVWRGDANGWRVLNTVAIPDAALPRRA